MTEVKTNVGEGPDKNTIILWGRVKDSRGNYLEGALVMVTALSAGGEEKCLGHTYSSRQGLYLIGISPEEIERQDGILRISASAGNPACEDKGAVGRRRFFALSGRESFPVLECQVINYQRLKLVASRSGEQLMVEALPETVKVSFYGDGYTGARVFGLRGRGYISNGDDQGEGTFSLVACAIGEGLREQEIIRMKTVPDDGNRKKLFFDSGSTLTDICI